MSQPFIEKYRPNSLDEIMSQDQVIQVLQNFEQIPNLLFYGPPGSGKTSCIKAFSKQIYQKNYQQMVLELNASDERGISTVREIIKQFVQTTSLYKQVKLVILDEADQMTQQAQFALRRIMQFIYQRKIFIVCKILFNCKLMQPYYFCFIKQMYQIQIQSFIIQSKNILENQTNSYIRKHKSRRQSG